MRRTKVVATIGPASEKPEVLREMIIGGMDVARIGLAHNDLETSVARFRLVREIAAELKKPVGMLVDLPGPKIRTMAFQGQGADFNQGAKVSLSAGSEKSTDTAIAVDYAEIVESVSPGDQIGFGDGSVLLSVEDKKKDRLECRVMHGGTLVGRPGVTIPAERLSLPTPTPEDLENLAVFLKEDVDMVALSFVRSAEDIQRLNLPPNPEGPLVIAKIETNLAVENLSEILEISGAIMVARGDLGVHYPLEDVPHLQKQIIRDCIAAGKPVITATQMLESMIHAPAPTRAEVSDIANAVFDGTSAVMLSAETAVGHNPSLVVETMARAAEKADENFNVAYWTEDIAKMGLGTMSEEPQAITHAITMAGARVAAELDLKAIICISGSGFTVRSMARFRPQVPILGFSTNPRTISQLSLSWGVTPILTDEAGSYEARVADALKRASAEGLLASGDLVGVLAGLNPNARSTDILRLHKVE